MNGNQDSPKHKAAKGHLMPVRSIDLNGKVALLAGALLLLMLANPAEAADASRITVDNQNSLKLLLNLFDGDDGACALEAKRKTVQPGTQKAMGCAGGGKKRCKVQVKIRDDLTTACRQSDQVKKCGSVNVMIVNDGETLTVLDGASDCEITTP